MKGRSANDYAFHDAFLKNVTNSTSVFTYCLQIFKQAYDWINKIHLYETLKDMESK